MKDVTKHSNTKKKNYFRVKILARPFTKAIIKETFLNI